jgi:hypothetical protein
MRKKIIIPSILPFVVMKDRIKRESVYASDHISGGGLTGVKV